MSEIFETPIIFSVSKVGTGDTTALFELSEGQYEVLTAAVSLSSTYAVKSSIGFKYKLADGSVYTHMLKEGWAFNKNGLAIDYIARIQGPGSIYATATFAASNTVTLYCQFRRIQTP